LIGVLESDENGNHSSQVRKSSNRSAIRSLAVYTVTDSVDCTEDGMSSAMVVISNPKKSTPMKTPFSFFMFIPI
jgi:hypothetical protein